MNCRAKRVARTCHFRTFAMPWLPVANPAYAAASGFFSDPLPLSPSVSVRVRATRRYKVFLRNCR